MTDWAERAACRGVNPELFFPPRADSDDAGRAAAICDHCPIAPECLQHALTEPRTHGIRAGHYFDDGHHREITKRPTTTSPQPKKPQPKPAPDRPGRGRPFPPAARTAALNRIHQARPHYPSDRATFDAVALELGLHPVTLGKWAREARKAVAP